MVYKYIYLLQMWQDLPTNLSLFVYTFECTWVLSFSWNPRCAYLPKSYILVCQYIVTSFCLFILLALIFWCVFYKIKSSRITKQNPNVLRNKIREFYKIKLKSFKNQNPSVLKNKIRAFYKTKAERLIFARTIIFRCL